MIFFTSDTHFGHRNVLKYTDRPGWLSKPNEPTDYDVRCMNNLLIDNWNLTVSPDDTVYHLGDFALGPKALHPEYRAKLNGKIVLILGNHDIYKKIHDVGFSEIHPELKLVVDGVKLFLRHYPLGGFAGDEKEWFGDYDYRLCGHVHALWKNRGSEINVGVDVQGYCPRTLNYLIDGISPRIPPSPPLGPNYHASGSHANKKIQVP